MRVLDLFSGIGGFSLGLERAGFRTVVFCEVEPYCRAVLARHWPSVPILGDIRAVTADTVRNALREQPGQRDGPSRTGETEPRFIDLICGGFPCQDISVAGKGAGLAGERSGLWVEFARLIGELRPRYAIVENVSALCFRGLGAVLGDLAAVGYDAEWHCIPAAYVGAPHRRDRIWIVAYASRNVRTEPATRWPERERTGKSSESMANTECQGLERQRGEARQPRQPQPWHDGSQGADADGSNGQAVSFGRKNSWQRCAPSFHWWESEPNVGRVAHGVSSRVDRLRALGNAVVPQVVEVIGKAIMRHANGH